MAGRTILTLSAALLFMLGGAALFLPREIAALLDFGQSRGMAATLQLAGGGFLGVGMLDWMVRHNRIGGIYNRPAGMANLMLFTVCGLSVAKGVAGGELPPAAWLLAGLFGTGAVAFGWLMFAHDPIAESSPG